MTLEELEAMVVGQQEQAQQKAFIDKYGTQFSGDEGIGMAILGEMSRRGIDAASVGADQVVQEILDAIRQEATAVLDKIKNDRDTVNALVEQVQEVQEAVAAATGAAAAGDGVLDAPPMPPPEPMPPDAGALPPDLGVPPPAEEAPPPAPEAPLAEGGPPPEGALPPEANAPPPPIPSDANLKTVTPAATVPSDVGVKRLVKRPQAPMKAAGWKPSSELLNRIAGGI
jgi:hypothetical protein